MNYLVAAGGKNGASVSEKELLFKFICGLFKNLFLLRFLMKTASGRFDLHAASDQRERRARKKRAETV